MAPHEQRQARGDVRQPALSPTVWEKMREYVQEVAHQIEESVQHVIVDSEDRDQKVEPRPS
jgi:hypothetical protein